LFFGSLYFLFAKNVFFPWAKATVVTFIIWSILYGLLLLGHIRLKGLEELVFAASGAVIFYFMLNPSVQSMLPFTVLPDATGSLSLTDQVGNIILSSQYLPWFVIGLAIFIIWKGRLYERVGL